MSPLQTVNGVGAVCRLDPVVGEGIETKLKKEAYLMGQPWENTAPLTVTHQSGLFNTEMDMTSGLSTVDSVIDSTKLDIMSATSTVDLAELFPDLTEILIPDTKDEDAPSLLATQAGDGTAADLPGTCDVPSPVTEAMDAISGGNGRAQLSSTSSCSEMSDYEDGLSPAEVDTTLEHFFNTFTDLGEFLVPAEETGPASTVDAATVRSLIDTPTTTENQTSLENLLAIEDGSLALSAVNATKRLKCEYVEEEEEESCQVAKKQRISKNNGVSKTKASPEDVYRQRRIKNNLACKRARQNRKKRDSNLSVTADNLEKENAQLRMKIKELTEIAEISRRALVNVLAK